MVGGFGFGGIGRQYIQIGRRCQFGQCLLDFLLLARQLGRFNAVLAGGAHQGLQALFLLRQQVFVHFHMRHGGAHIGAHFA